MHAKFHEKWFKHLEVKRGDTQTPILLLFLSQKRKYCEKKLIFLRSTKVGNRRLLHTHWKILREREGGQMRRRRNGINRKVDK
jgi:hypothetical protein